MIESVRELIQKGSESDWCLKTREIRFASGLVGQLREVTLPLVDSLEGVAKMVCV